MSDIKGDLGKAASDARADTRGYVAQHPFKAVAIALGVGLFLAIVAYVVF